MFKVSKRWPSIFKTARRAGLWPLLFVPLLIAAGCETRRGAETPDPEARTASIEMDTTVPASDAAIRAMIAQAQLRLARLGYKPGHYDGVIGPQTRTAIRHYQVDRGLPQNSSVTGELLNDLNTSIEDRRDHPVTWLPGTLPGPDYQPGDAFIYSNGRVERVVSVENGVVSWRTDKGESFEASENFILPWQNWGSKAERGHRWIHAAPDTLWPLMLGIEQSFAANSIVQYGSRPENRRVARETWRCAAQARERVSLAAGSYDTIKITCEMTAKDSSSKQTRVWYYAPRLRHYVRLVDFDETSTAPRQVDLVAMQPTGLAWPPIVRDGLVNALEHAVESADTGKPIVWESSAIQAKITIRPTDRYLDYNGVRCRRILQDLSKSGSHKTYPGLACRTPQGEWQVVGLHEGGSLMPAVAHR